MLDYKLIRQLCTQAVAMPAWLLGCRLPFQLVFRAAASLFSPQCWCGNCGVMPGGERQTPAYSLQGGSLKGKGELGFKIEAPSGPLSGGFPAAFPSHTSVDSPSPKRGANNENPANKERWTA